MIGRDSPKLRDEVVAAIVQAVVDRIESRLVQLVRQQSTDDRWSGPEVEMLVRAAAEEVRGAA